MSAKAHPPTSRSASSSRFLYVTLTLSYTRDKLFQLLRPNSRIIRTLGRENQSRVVLMALASLPRLYPSEVNFAHEFPPIPQSERESQQAIPTEGLEADIRCSTFQRGDVSCRNLLFLGRLFDLSTSRLSNAMQPILGVPKTPL
jgi:hypothetical protein